MSYCLNPKCPNPTDSSNATRRTCCQCGSELLLQGRYRVIQSLGGGGFGKTFEIEDERGKRKVLKVLLKEHPKAVELFQQEARVLSRLNHPGIPKVDPDGYFIYQPVNGATKFHCLVMEKIEGSNLQDWLKSRGNKPISQEEALDWLQQLSEILDQVHKLQYFHRDIKPHNIMRRSNGQLVLIDFGTAREVSGTYLVKVGQGQNVTGIVSPGYTPPEQSNGKAVPQSDFYALGRTFVYLLTGKPPTAFPENPRTGKLMWRKGTQNISNSLADVIDYLMAPFPGNRPQNPQMVLQCLAEVDLNQTPDPQNSPEGTTGLKTKGTTSFSNTRQGSTTGSLSLSHRSNKKNPFSFAINSNLLAKGSLFLFIGLLMGSQIYGYSRYGFFPSDPILLLSSLPSSEFLETTLQGKIGEVNSLALSPNGQFLVSGSHGTIRVWNFKTRQPLYSMAGHKDAVMSLNISRDSSLLVSGSDDNFIRLWNLKTGTRILSIGGHKGGIKAVAMSPDGKVLASGGGDNQILLRRLDKDNRGRIQGTRFRTFTSHKGPITALAFSPDGKTLASASRDKTVRLWNLSNGTLKVTLTGHTEPVNAIAFSPDGQTLVSGSDDKTIRFWDVRTGKPQPRIIRRDTPKIKSLAFSPNGQMLLGGGDDRRIHIWDLKAGTKKAALLGHAREVSAMVFSPDGKSIISGSPDQTLKIWRMPQ